MLVLSLPNLMTELKFLLTIRMVDILKTFKLEDNFLKILSTKDEQIVVLKLCKKYLFLLLMLSLRLELKEDLIFPSRILIF